MLRIVIIGCLLTTGTFCFADVWTFFHPESVIDYGCTTALVSQAAYGEHRAIDVWIASAHAKRKDMGNWETTVGVFPNSKKGRHSAEKACSQWMDKASEKVKQAK